MLFLLAHCMILPFVVKEKFAPCTCSICLFACANWEAGQRWSKWRWMYVFFFTFSVATQTIEGSLYPSSLTASMYMSFSPLSIEWYLDLQQQRCCYVRREKHTHAKRERAKRRRQVSVYFLKGRLLFNCCSGSVPESCTSSIVVFIAFRGAVVVCLWCVWHGG